MLEDRSQSDEPKCHYSQNMMEGRHVVLLVLQLSLLMGTRENNQNLYEIKLLNIHFLELILREVEDNEKLDPRKQHEEAFMKDIRKKG